MRRGWAAATLGALTLGGQPTARASDAGAAAGLDKLHTYDIAPQDLGDAIDEICRPVRVSCGADPEVMDGKQAPAIRGTFTVRSALTQALSLTDLTYDVFSAVSVKIRKASAPGEVAKATPSKPTSQTRSEAASTPTSVDALAEVTISGSLMERNGALGGSPVRVFNSDDILMSGAFSTEDLLNLLPQSFNSSTPLSTLVFSTVSGAPNANWGAGFDLRGFGPGATVVLLNGQRAPPSAAAKGEYFDLTLLPFLMVDGIEVVIDGASAPFGPAAIGGVVNVLLPSPQSGARTSLNLSAPTRGGGKVYSLNQSVGYHWRTVRAGVSLLWQEQEPVYAASRDPTQEIARSGYRRAHIGPDNEIGVALATLEWDISPGSKLRLDGSVAHKDMTLLYTSNSVIDVDVANRADTLQTWGMGELAFSLSKTWEGRVNAGASRSRVDAGLSQAIPEIEWLLESSGDTTYSAQFFNAHVEGPIPSLAHNGVILAFDTGVRREVAEGAAFQLSSDSMNVKHAAIVATIPLLHTQRDGKEVSQLDLIAAERFEDHSSFGSSTVHKFELIYRPAEPIALRATVGESIRPPQLSQLSLGGSWQVIESVAGGAANSSPMLVAVRYGSNPTLGPERARTTTAGLDLHFQSPVDTAMSVSWFSARYTNRIAPAKVSYLTALNDPAYESIRTRRDEVGDDARMNAEVESVIAAPDSRVLPCAVAGYTSGPCSAIPPQSVGAVLDFRNRNLGETATSGIDLSATMNKSTPWGTFSARFDGTRLFEFEDRVTHAAPAIDNLNKIFQPPRTRWRGGVGYARGRLKASGFVNFMNAYTNNRVFPNERIESHATVDVTLHWEAAAYGFDLRANNLLDADPPYVTSPSGNGFNFDAMNANPYGRVIAFTLKKTW